MPSPYAAISLRCHLLTLPSTYAAISLRCHLPTLPSPYAAISLRCRAVHVQETRNEHSEKTRGLYPAQPPNPALSVATLKEEVGHCSMVPSLTFSFPPLVASSHMALAAVHVQERRDRHSEAARTSGHLESEFARAGRAESGPSRQAKRYAHAQKSPRPISSLSDPIRRSSTQCLWAPSNLGEHGRVNGV
jgi:hypothetical protein